ncbi:Nif3-like dinuclear metal center hexameric protein [Shewanella sp. Isolate11]|uniref:Nif3-like dinuclear metal center hexameric protein n=1 Tax=Shewanella sp. Isolate11 TaxID=2908530 RepID=UPI001EFDD140|nr:Nif3-like dinuclear metal center hexameric protein [Shewanella sp. Isolate11]MCG9697002.1 Nif3-like dinuclear metal center hexameric protein [Shewanella sp. Isolate11]
MNRSDLTQYLAEFLQVSNYKDYAPNGLQVQGCDQINTIVTGVTACQALIDRAVELNADALLVHHGFFWKGETAVLTGMKYQRIKSLINNDINLYGYHLPLDGHLMLGNNAELARKLGLIDAEAVASSPQALVWQGHLDAPMSVDDFNALLVKVLGRKALHIGSNDKPIHHLAWCSGGAQDYIDIAAELGADAFISGEVSERTFHSAVEQNIHYFAAGHHATERFGIQALGEHLVEKFGVTHHFVDIDNPV